MEIYNKKNSKLKFEILTALHNHIEYLSKIVGSPINTAKKIKSKHMIIKSVNEQSVLYNDKKNLINTINELKLFTKDRDNIIFPFLDILPSLIYSYIQSDLDEGKIDKFEYISFFSHFIANSFIDKNCLGSIYSFFSGIFSDIKTMKEKDSRLPKLIKAMELWLNFFTFRDKKEYAESTICFLGGNMNLNFQEKISLLNNTIEIKIVFSRNEYITLIDKNDCFLNINHKTLVTYKDIQNYIKKRFDTLIYVIQMGKIFIYFGNNESFFEKDYDKTDISDIYFLQKFYGQVKLICVNIKALNDNKEIENCYENIYRPLLLSELGEFRNDNTSSTIKLTLKINDKNYTKINYINHGDSNFNIVEYMGNIKSFLPFAYIIKNLFTNNDIKKIGKESKNKICFILLSKIFKGIFNCIFLNNYDKVDIRKYLLFIYSISPEIINAYNISNKEGDKDFNITELLKELLNESYIIDKIGSLKDGDAILNFYIKIKNLFGDESFQNTLIDILQDTLTTIQKEYPYKETDDLIRLYSVLPEMSYGKLYLKIMKELFIYNRFWGQKEHFFNMKNNQIPKKVKYKHINYYTRNFQQPILFPILELDKYYPKLSSFELGNLYNEPNESILNYDFSLSGDEFYINNKVSKFIENFIRKSKNLIKCCLVKKTHHIKGAMFILEFKSPNDGNFFDLYFLSSKEQETEEICNRPANSEQDNYHKNLCYGSIFFCPKTNAGKIYNIKCKNIKFILIRQYFHRVSAIEIFTSNNKSYYFNFNSFFSVEKTKNLNEILKKISKFFKEIKVFLQNNKTIILGFYNPIYESSLYPLFSEEINIWKKKNKIYSNFEKLSIINLFSNRSFVDIFQYPIYPIFYQFIGIKERPMNTHIGLLDINEESLARKKSILYSYKINSEDLAFSKSKEVAHLFNTFASNPVYICNYLIRVFPYALISIELQGTGFDSPNRLFYSLPKTFMNTLTQKSDHRELLPEFFYLPELFENNNNLKLGQLTSGEEVGNVLFFDKDKDDPEKYKKYKFMSDINKILEDEKYINQWIDLNFGIDQKETKNHERYFERVHYINLDNNPEFYNDFLSLQKLEFGVIPFQLFYTKFPAPVDNIDYIEQLIEANKYIFQKDHKFLKNEINCFRCKGKNFIPDAYIKIINEIPADNLPNRKKYSFTGDVYGFVTIRELNAKQSNSNIKQTKSKEEGKEKDKYTIIHKLSDHSKEIKYIDFNPRLNLFLTYSLDGFINIYTFPSIKLIRVIKADNYYEQSDHLRKVVLVSYPYPMIFCHNTSSAYVFSINGELIKAGKSPVGANFVPCIDKYLGIVKDFIEMRIYMGSSEKYNINNIFLPKIA